MNLRDLHYLVALAEHRHFGHAAEACFVSQPTLSTQIRKLEDELGVSLVERTPRKVLLTDVGREIAARARDVLNDVEQIKGIARRTLDPGIGHRATGHLSHPGALPAAARGAAGAQALPATGTAAGGGKDRGSAAPPARGSARRRHRRAARARGQPARGIPVRGTVPAGRAAIACAGEAAVAEVVRPQHAKPVAAGGWPLPARPGAGGLPPGRRRRTHRFPRHQPGDVAANGGRRRGHHPAAHAGGQAAGGAGAERAPDRVPRASAESAHRHAVAQEFGHGGLSQTARRRVQGTAEKPARRTQCRVNAGIGQTGQTVRQQSFRP
ncbi:LysR family transcriptional regulator [Rhodanobacter sp. 115]|nr:LysR family transcriptional regulator [Rhodanobacter sp. 115]